MVTVYLAEISFTTTNERKLNVSVKMRYENNLLSRKLDLYASYGFEDLKEFFTTVYVTSQVIFYRSCAWNTGQLKNSSRVNYSVYHKLDL